MSEKWKSIRHIGGFTLRKATTDDLDDMARIHKVGFTEEPQVNYCYPSRENHPEEYLHWTKREYETYLQRQDKFVVYVVDVLVNLHGKVDTKPVGIAVWDTKITAKANPMGSDERSDANITHCTAFREATEARWKNYLEEYGEDQLYLSALVVHPDFRRRGVGTMLVDWGIRTGEEKCVAVTLCASPMGRMLYEHLKFERIDTEVVRVKDEEETLESTVMVRETDAKTRIILPGSTWISSFWQQVTGPRKYWLSLFNSGNN